jgi:DNA-binding XRE family transcriptional regulator
MDNHRDKYRDGTDQRGEKNSQAELIRKHAKQIYKLKGKMTQQEIADSFGVSRQAVSDIHRGITWARVTGAKKR